MMEKYQTLKHLKERKTRKGNNIKEYNKQWKERNKLDRAVQKTIESKANKKTKILYRQRAEYRDS